MKRKELYLKVLEYIKLYPSLKNEMLDLFHLANDEILEGGSEVHECELALSEIEDLITDLKKTQNETKI